LKPRVESSEHGGGGRNPGRGEQLPVSATTLRQTVRAEARLFSTLRGIDSSSGSSFVIPENIRPGKSCRREYGERNYIPGAERGQRNDDAQSPVESRLVAESVAPGDPPPKLSPGQPH